MIRGRNLWPPQNRQYGNVAEGFSVNIRNQKLVTDLKGRLLRVLQKADEPMDYLDLIAATRSPGIDIAIQLEGLERTGEVTRHKGEEGFLWSFDPSTA